MTMKTLILSLVLILFSFVANAQELGIRAPRSREELSLSFAPIIKRVAPAVVNIYTRAVVRQRVINPFMNDPLFREFFGEAMPQGLSKKRVENSLGSGVIVDAAGLVVTNNHVIQGADEIIVVLADKREFEATVITTDKRSDLAVLRLQSKGESFPTLPLMDSDDAQVGDLVLAIGNPFGVGQTVTMGIVSAVARSAEVDSSDYNYFIQTDAAINPGNSGGALISADGKLMGVPSAIYSRDGGSLGIGFAIPSNLVRTVISSASQGGKAVVRGWVGVITQTITSDIAASVGLTRPAGVIIKNVHAQSTARDAGLRAGDVVLAVNGKPVEDEEAFRFRIATAPLNSTLVFQVLRGGVTNDVNVRVIAPPQGATRVISLSGAQPLAGAKIVDLSPAIAQELGLQNEFDEGVIVVAVAATSPAARLGLRKGDMILAVNNTEIKQAKDVEDSVEKSSTAWRITVRRGGKVLTVVVQ